MLLASLPPIPACVCLHRLPITYIVYFPHNLLASYRQTQPTRLTFCLYLHICLSVYLSVYLSASMFNHLPVRPCTRSLHISVRLLGYLSTDVPVCLSVRMPTYCPSVCLAACPPFHLPACSSARSSLCTCPLSCLCGFLPVASSLCQHQCVRLSICICPHSLPCLSALLPAAPSSLPCFSNPASQHRGCVCPTDSCTTEQPRSNSRAIVLRPRLHEHGGTLRPLRGRSRCFRGR